MTPEEKYEQALKAAAQWHRDGTDAVRAVVECIFPELRESEDERIRKALLGSFKYQQRESYTDKEWLNGIKLSEIVSWLEKQGKQKPIDESKPKFKVGDWITNDEYTWKIIDIKPLDYIIQSQTGSEVDDTISHVDEHFHLWTIQDAKDGDVLANKYGAIFINAGSNGGVTLDCYCYLSVQNKFYIEEHKTGSWLYKNNIKLATKEQCDLLFQKMHEAGYEWDAEKKELKKIEQKPVEWSEEDEDARDIAIRIIQNGGDDCAGILDSDKALNWLKSIKPNHWKPSEEQMGALEIAARCRAMPWEQLIALYNDLKNL